MLGDISEVCSSLALPKMWVPNGIESIYADVHQQTDVRAARYSSHYQEDREGVIKEICSTCCNSNVVFRGQNFVKCSSPVKLPSSCVSMLSLSLCSG